MPRLILLAVALVLALAVPAGAAEKVSVRDWFELWNGCRPVRLIVESLPDGAGKIGLREGDLETAVRSRLRGARIYNETADSYFYVNVNVVGKAFSTDMQFERAVEVQLPSKLEQQSKYVLLGYAATWFTGSAGTHGGRSGFILSGVTRHTDEFIDEYLRVNAESCGNSN